MAITRFDDPILVPGDQLEVGGPFDLERDVILGDVTICFLLIQNVPPGESNSGSPPVIVHGRTSWDPGMGAQWQTVIPAGGLLPGPVRTIGAAIIVRSVPPEPIPVIAAVTWCVQREVKVATVANGS